MPEKILVVDDSKELRTILSAQLRKQGFEVELGHDGQDGLEVARRFRPHLIVMDIMMPRMDGFTAAREMRKDELLQRTPIILLSALGGEEDIIKGIECGADDYLVKPFKAPELTAKIRMLIRKAGGFTNKPEQETKRIIADPAAKAIKETGQITTKEFAGFSIVAKLGQGGSGTVYRAIEPMHNTPVALKVVSPFISQSPGFIDRFARSSDISIRLRHPNIVRCFTIGQYQGVHYLTQELMEGPTMDAVLEKEGPMDERRALRLMRQLADALAYLEAEKLMHRDIKPANIFVVKGSNDEDVAKIADFGLSRGTFDAGQTMEGHVLGTPHYLSPEQALGAKDIDTRADLYSLAITMYQMLTGKLPFEGDAVQQLVIAHISHQPRNPREHRPELSEKTTTLLLRLLAKKPDERVARVADALPLIDDALAALGG